ncbi:hypothetical protein Tco_0088153 [Tanacetum coccineum]
MMLPRRLQTKNDVTSIVCLVSGEELSIARHVLGASTILDLFKTHFPWHVTLTWKVVPTYVKAMRLSRLGSFLHSFNAITQEPPTIALVPWLVLTTLPLLLKNFLKSLPPGVLFSLTTGKSIFLDEFISWDFEVSNGHQER